MPDTKLIKTTLDFAESFLEKKRRTDSANWAGLQVAQTPPKKLAIFWWGGSIPLVEVPLQESRGGGLSGYLLVSTSKELPPVIEYATSDAPLSVQISQLLSPALTRSEIQPKSVRYVFITSTEIYAEITTDKKSGITAIAIPTLATFKPKTEIKLSLKPSSVFDKAIVKGQWDNLTPGAPGDLPEVVLQNAIPVRYQQNCDKYANLLECGINIQQTQTYCSPNAIAGCVPVGWAMLLSAWKKTGYWDSSKIWNGSGCWSIEWPSWGGWANPSQCPDVEKTIWRLHQLMATTPDGGTDNNNTIAGAAIFGEQGLSWKYAQAQNKPFEFAIGVIQAGQPLLWTANGIWDAALGQLSSTPVPGGVGHAVVAYGYKKADRTLLIALGWGYSFANKYVNYDQYRITNCLYLTSLKLAAKGNSILQVD